MIQAKRESDTIRMKAEAIAESNLKIAKSLTPELVKYEEIKKWNGVLPQVSGGATPIINLSK